MISIDRRLEMINTAQKGQQERDVAIAAFFRALTDLVIEVTPIVQQAVADQKKGRK